MLRSILFSLILISSAHPGLGKPAFSIDSLKTHTVLFRITHPDLQHDSYIFGTHHAFGKAFFDSLRHAAEALASSSLLIKENLNLPGHLALDIINRRSPTTKWQKYLGHDDYGYILSLFSSSDLDFDKMTPAELFAFLSRFYKERICLGKDPSDPHLSLDDYIGQLAREKQLEVAGLETTEEQLELINKDIEGMPRNVHRKRLAAMIARIQAGTRDNCSEIDWYRNMDFDFKLAEPCTNALVLSDRNQRWMVQIQEYLTTRTCFIAVGLSHLMFECGLLNQLSGLGFVITPIRVK